MRLVVTVSISSFVGTVLALWLCLLFSVSFAFQLQKQVLRPPQHNHHARMNRIRPLNTRVMPQLLPHTSSLLMVVLSSNNSDDDMNGIDTESIPSTTEATAETFTTEDATAKMEELKVTIADATKRALESEQRVENLQEEMEQALLLLNEKEQELLKQSKNDMAASDKNFLTRIVEFGQKLQAQQEESEEQKQLQAAKAHQREEFLKCEVDVLQQSLEETQQLLLQGRETADEMRTRLLNAEDQLEFEQMRFTKASMELNQQIKEERDRLSLIEKNLTQEQGRFQNERSKLQSTAEEATSKWQQTTQVLSEKTLQFEEDRGAMSAEIASQKEIIAATKIQLSQETERFTVERQDMKKRVAEEQLKLKQAETKLFEKEEEFKQAEKNLEMKIVFEKQRVAKVENQLIMEQVRVAEETLALEMSLLDDQARLSAVEAKLKQDTEQFKKEKKKLEEKIQDGDRVRQLKARQMNERYNAIRNEMGKRLEEQKRDARTERSRLIRKYDEKIEIITAALEPQAKELESSKEQIGDLKMALDQMVKEKTRALDDSRRVEKLYQDKLGERSAEVAKLEMSIISYVELLSKRDAQIEQYETSYRELLRLTLRLTRERIGTQGRKALQSTGERIRNQGRRVRNGLFRQGTKK